MCLIVTIVMLVMAVQNLYNQLWGMGILQLTTALMFGLLLWHNIERTRCERDANCNSCGLPAWLEKYLEQRRANREKAA